jgi:hypothetical protein
VSQQGTISGSAGVGLTASSSITSPWPDEDQLPSPISNSRLDSAFHTLRLSPGAIFSTSLDSPPVPMSVLTPTQHRAPKPVRQAGCRAGNEAPARGRLPAARRPCSCRRRRRRQERKHEYPFCSGLSHTSGLMLRRSGFLGIAAEIESQRARRVGDDQTGLLVDERLGAAAA